MYVFSCSTSQLTHLLSVLSSRPKSSYDIATLHLMPIRNPSIEENTHRQRGAKLVFDGVELPRVRRIPSRKTRSEGDKDANGADENMEIENSSNSSRDLELEQPFARESKFSRCMSPLLYRRVNVRSDHML